MLPSVTRRHQPIDGPKKNPTTGMRSSPGWSEANFVPSDAINQLEMFQAATFNPTLIDKELGLGESIGMNTMRVFLQDQLWAQDPRDSKQRLDTFLTIAAKHHIRLCWSCSIPAGRRTRILAGSIRPFLESTTPAGYRVRASSDCWIPLSNRS